MRRWPLALILVASPAAANIPAEYVACEGAPEGEPCQLPGPRHGNCVLDTLCEDPPETPVNECLLCRDGCGALDEGESCLRRDKTHGVCVRQPVETCTDKPETSFDECNRCQAGEPEATAPEEGCEAVDAAVAAPWALLLLAGVVQLRRKRA
jgi:uncharacterized protein (TIGR03382 family)